MVHRYTFGIEEEFFLTDPVSREVADHPPQALFLACQAEFGDAVKDVKPGDSVMLLVRRDDATQFIAVTVPKSKD